MYITRMGKQEIHTKLELEIPRKGKVLETWAWMPECYQQILEKLCMMM
jgi:hypothetical protein